MRVRARRHGHPLSVVMFDVDHFKKVNDTVGHAGGDAVLCDIASRIMRSVRTEDVAGRWGGEEFLLILRETGAEGARVLADRICESLAREPVMLGDRQLHVSVSGGCATGTGDDPEGLVRRADDALYRAKADGRNRVVVSPPLKPTVLPPGPGPAPRPGG